MKITPNGLAKQWNRLSGREIARYRTGIGLVSQSFNLFPHLTVMGNIIRRRTGVLGWTEGRDRKGRGAAAQGSYLEEKANAYPATLSGGHNSAGDRALAYHGSAKIMLFDEPTSALDPELTERCCGLRDLAIGGRTAIIVTHELRFAREVASQVVFMEGGGIVEEGPRSRC